MGLAVKPVRRGAEDTLVAERALPLAADLRLAKPRLYEIDSMVIALLRRWSTPALRIALGLVFVWFGTLKLFGMSPVAAMVTQTYPFLPPGPFIFLLSIWETGIGCSLILKRALRVTLALLLAHLIGTFLAVAQAPSLFFFHGNPLLLTTEGEFVAKNIVLVAAALVIGGYELMPLKRAAVSQSSAETERVSLAPEACKE